MTRRHDWRPRLHEALDSFRGKPFVWGECDCVHFVSACVLAMTGHDQLSYYSIPVYGTPGEAIDAVKTLGFAALPDLLAEHFESVHPSMACDGDIAIIESTDTGYGLGIFELDRIHVLSARGWAFVPRNQACMAFRI
jgi:hypothetical protein